MCNYTKIRADLGEETVTIMKDIVDKMRAKNQEGTSMYLSQKREFCGALLV